MNNTSPSKNRRKVFVIHGRNNAAREQLFIFLRSLGLSPLEWEHAVEATGSGTPYIGQVLDTAFEIAQAIIVLETPDDIAYLRSELANEEDSEGIPQGQPRPNVLFEAGMAMGRNPDRTIIIEFGKIKQFSDIHGRHTIRLDNTAEKRIALKSRLNTAGCAVDNIGSDWLTSGDLNPPPAVDQNGPLGKKVPQPKSPPVPRLSATHHSRGPGKIGFIEITNHGPGDVYDLDVEELNATNRGLIRTEGVLPIPRLPSSKSIKLDYMGNMFSGDNKKYFTLLLEGQTADSQPVKLEEFVSMS